MVPAPIWFGIIVVIEQTQRGGLGFGGEIFIVLIWEIDLQCVGGKMDGEERDLNDRVDKHVCRKSFSY